MYQMKKGGSKSAKQQAAIAMSMKAAGKKPKMKMGGGVDNSNFAKLAPPYDKATYADKIAGAKKNAGEMKKRGGSVGTSKKLKTYAPGGTIDGPGKGFFQRLKSKLGLSKKASQSIAKPAIRKAFPSIEKPEFKRASPSIAEPAMRDLEPFKRVGREGTKLEGIKPRMQNSLSLPKIGGIDKKRMGGSCGTPKSLRKGK